MTETDGVSGSIRPELVRAVGFDIGGTLVQSPTASITQTLSDHLGVAPGEMRNHLALDAKRHRQTIEELAARLSVAYHPAGYAQLVAIMKNLSRQIEGSAPFPESVHVLRKLRLMGYRVYCLSNIVGAFAYPVDRLLGLHSDEPVLLSCDTGYVKPEPAAFLHASREVEVEPRSMLHIGDSWVEDVRGARSVGCQAMLVSRHEHQVSVPRDEAVIHDLAHVLTILREGGAQ